MSEEEQNSIVGKTILELQSKKKKLACMETKAKKMASELSVIAGMMKEVPEFHSPPSLNPGLIPEHPDNKECKQLLGSIYDARSEISTLHKDLTRMGVQFPIE